MNTEISDALMNNRPVVALESTIITHGMPHPHNLETAIEVERIVREQVIKSLKHYLHWINDLLTEIKNSSLPN